MEITQMNAFDVIGISVRTTNQNNQAAKDIGALWSKFMTENIKDSIPNIKDETIYAVYTDYESDHTHPYTTVLGYKVYNLDHIPKGLVGISIPESSYYKLTAKGDLTSNAIVDAWLKVWNTDLDRTYQCDFEAYGEKAIDPTNGEADLFIGIK